MRPARRWALLAGWSMITIATAWWVIKVALLQPDERSIASGYGQFVLAAAGFLIVAAGPVARTFSPSPSPALDEQADLLAQAMQNQWQSAAVERRLLEPSPLPIRWCRTSLPVAGPISGAVCNTDGHNRFQPFPGLPRVTSSRLKQGGRRALHSVYGGLASGRLVIIGPPGSGKSTAALLLLLDALHYREAAPADERSRIPVPVMFTLHSWNPGELSFDDWIIRKLCEIPVFRNDTGALRAAALLRSGQVAVFLDGLDEIAVELRPQVLRAMSDQATIRLVLLSRNTELVDTAHAAHLVGAVALEVQAIGSKDAVEFLLRHLVCPEPPAWRAVVGEMRSNPNGRLARALNNPLALTLLRDAYSPTAPVDELLDRVRFPCPDDVMDHLLDRFVVTAYTLRVGQQRAPSPKVAERMLSYIAQRLAQEGTNDLSWWTVPMWTPARVRVALGATAGAALFAVIAWWIFALSSIVVTNVDKSWYKMAGAIVYGVAGGLAGGYGAKPAIKPQRVRSSWWWRPLTVRGMKEAIGPGLAAGILVGLLGSMVSWYGVGLAIGIPAMLSGWLCAALVIGLAQPSVGDSRTGNPMATWRREVRTWVIGGISAWLVCGITGGAAIGLAGFLIGGYATMREYAMAGALIAGLTGWLIVGFTGWLGVSVGGAAAWPVLVARAAHQLRREPVPWRMMAFLEDARHRQVMRTIGPIYQFRHAKLQDRLAAARSNLSG